MTRDISYSGIFLLLLALTAQAEILSPVTDMQECKNDIGPENDKAKKERICNAKIQRSQMLLGTSPNGCLQNSVQHRAHACHAVDSASIRTTAHIPKSMAGGGIIDDPVSVFAGRSAGQYRVVRSDNVLKLFKGADELCSLDVRSVALDCQSGEITHTVGPLGISVVRKTYSSMCTSHAFITGAGRICTNSISTYSGTTTATHAWN